MEDTLHVLDNRKWVWENLDSLIQLGAGKSIAQIHINDSDIFLVLSEKCPEVLDDDAVAEYVCYSHSGCMQYMSSRIRNNAYFMEKAMREDPANARFIGEMLSNDFFFMRRIVKDSHRAVLYASEALRDDPAFFYDYIENSSDVDGKIPYLECFSERLRSDPYMAKRLVEQHIYNYAGLSGSVKMNSEYAHAFLECGGYVTDVPAALFEEDLALAGYCVRRTNSYYRLLPEGVKDNVFVALNALDTYVPHSYSWYIPGGWGDEYIDSDVMDMTENVMNNVDFQKYLIVAYCKTSFFKIEDYDILHEDPKKIFDILKTMAKTYWVYDTDDFDKVERLDLSEAIRIEREKIMK